MHEINTTFGLEGTATKFVAGHGSISMYIKTMFSGNDFAQLTLNSTGASLGTSENGHWDTLWEAALKSDTLLDKGLACYRIETHENNMKYTIKFSENSLHKFMFILGDGNGSACCIVANDSGTTNLISESVIGINKNDNGEFGLAVPHWSTIWILSDIRYKYTITGQQT